MPNYLGLDGFRFGWVAAWIDERGDHGFDYSPGLTRLLALPHARAMIDMPIGLNPSGYRACDLRARELIGPAVFLGARRDLWRFPDMAAANRFYWTHEGKGRGVSAQLWNIRDKIREVDEVMTPARQATIGEAHPELVFWNLAGRVRLEPKTSPRGREQRVALLRDRGFTRIERWLTLRRGTGIGRDDLIDACACAVAARDSTRRGDRSARIADGDQLLRSISPRDRLRLRSGCDHCGLDSRRRPRRSVLLLSLGIRRPSLATVARLRCERDRSRRGDSVQRDRAERVSRCSSSDNARGWHWSLRGLPEQRDVFAVQSGKK